MNSKLLKKKNGGKQPREGLDDQQENDLSRPTKGHETLHNRVNPAVDARAIKDFPGLLKRNYRPAKPGEPVARGTMSG
jgi:hypothetical protein